MGGEESSREKSQHLERFRGERESPSLRKASPASAAWSRGEREAVTEPLGGLWRLKLDSSLHTWDQG